MLSSLTLPSMQHRYIPGEVIGHGDESSVYRAVRRGDDTPVAIKVFDQRMERDVSFVAHFRREARLARALDHPHVLHTYGYGYADQHYYLVLEYIDGGSFVRLLPDPGTGPSPEAITALLHVCEGLQYIHERGLTHRNVEPSNILLRSSGEAVMGDIGQTHRPTSTGLTMTDVLLESVTYASPEGVLGKPVTPASDIYSFGLVLYRAFTGTQPFTGGNPVQLAMRQIGEEPPPPRLANPDLSPAVEQVILRCLRKDPAERYAGMAEVREALSDALSEAAALPADRTMTLDAAVNLGLVERPAQPRTGSTARRVRRPQSPSAAVVAPGAASQPRETQEAAEDRPPAAEAPGRTADALSQAQTVRRSRRTRSSPIRHLVHDLAERIAEATAEDDPQP